MTVFAFNSRIHLASPKNTEGALPIWSGDPGQLWTLCLRLLGDDSKVYKITAAALRDARNGGYGRRTARLLRKGRSNAGAFPTANDGHFQGVEGMARRQKFLEKNSKLEGKSVFAALCDIAADHGQVMRKAR